MKELNNRLKSGNIDRAYIFSGPERYLIRAYEKRLRTAALGDMGEMNAVVFEGEKCLPDAIIAAAETLPFMSPKRLIIVKDSGLLQTGRKDASDTLVDYLPVMPETTVLLFIEHAKAPDKRGRLYKHIVQKGLAVDFTTPSEGELITWLTKLCHAEGTAMTKGAALAMLRRIGMGSADGIMDILHTEAMKLIAYAGPGGTIETSEVEALCRQTAWGKVFDMVKELGQKNIKALESFNALLAMKESPLMILSMMARQFRLILICAGLKAQGAAGAEIAGRAGIRDFMAADFIRQSGNFSQETLTAALSDCLEAEYSVKTGLITDRLAVEKLIIKYCGF
ncbi:MAG: DNA polymerase III subunit delta [Clostridiales bacterium]|jgi:DNA polymerase-3 subunit delta|nr:DNA polymerase III subunit delta [Clostridiales bacterium]